jgi:cytochrome c5
MSRARPSALVIATLALFTACGPATAPPPAPLSPAAVVAAKSTWAEVTEQSLNEGRELFVKSCNRCHGYPDVFSESQAEWPALVQEMGKRAKLDEGQMQLVTHFIIAARTAK